MHILKLLIVALSIGVLVVSCSEEEEEGYVPKMRGYFKIDLPPHEYRPLEQNRPYTFEYSKYAQVEDDTTGLTGDHWVNVFYKDFDANIQITYKVPKNKKEFLQIVDEHIKLTNKHQVRAYSIEEIQVMGPKGRKYYVYELVGDVPSQFQFYATDTTRHFLRGALYFKTSQKNDSLAPVIEYIKTDVIHMLNTLEWKNK
ncbi:MAG TPA: gliding motility lipoprotein GldD [Cytophagales bacterium]|nr:gliding motility lipoprotein GldD [Cytophagales bacterium]